MTQSHQKTPPRKIVINEQGYHVDDSVETVDEQLKRGVPPHKIETKQPYVPMNSVMPMRKVRMHPEINRMINEIIRMIDPSADMSMIIHVAVQHLHEAAMAEYEQRKQAEN